MIRLVLADVDGCLTAGERRPIDLDVLRDVATINSRSRVDRTVPAVSLCTGRPAPYVEVLLQAIDCDRPSIFENGCGLVRLTPYGFRAHPRIDENVLIHLRDGIDTLDRELVHPGRAMWQPGKSYSGTLYPIGRDVHALWLAARALLDEEFHVDEGIECINLMPAGIDKGAGVEWLATECGLSLDEVAGVGDADPDLAFLERTGFSAAPSNATANVRARVDYVSAQPNGKGLIDILDQIIEANRRLRAS